LSVLVGPELRERALLTQDGAERIQESSDGLFRRDSRDDNSMIIASRVEIIIMWVYNTFLIFRASVQLTFSY
jgi:hypothetical protein